MPVSTTSSCLVAFLALLQLAAGFVVPTQRLARAHAVIPQACAPMMIADGESKSGTCKWFNVEKGFGFIAIDDLDQDIFVHQSDIYAPGFRSLAEGEEVEFRVSTDSKTGKLKAVEVTGPDGAYVQGAPRSDGY